MQENDFLSSITFITNYIIDTDREKAKRNEER